MTGEAPRQTGGPPRQGLLDTNVLVLRRWVDPAELPDEMAISAITLAELSAGPHHVRPNIERDIYDEHEERARRTQALQRAESEFEPVPFDAEAARKYGRVTAAVVAAARKPRMRVGARPRLTAQACPLRARPCGNGSDSPPSDRSPPAIPWSSRPRP
jgi:predicted nucleic acid-binding protein